ncbi:MAG TPA: division/cell wall cluster transcriptional repressor MraZ [Acidiferrobacter sp.]|nr:division/cell wall cluster transcriptional repressor MraZ [Acidiferrobacter sp.]
MFRGVNNISLDGKGRIAIPTRYREGLVAHCAGQLIMTVDRDHCLLLYPLPEWEVIEAKLASLPSFHPQTRRLQRLLIGHATECDMDGAGRILLPAPLREFAALDKDIMLIGQGNKFELWDQATWNTCRAEWLAATDNEELPTELQSLSL